MMVVATNDSNESIARMMRERLREIGRLLLLHQLLLAAQLCLLEFIALIAWSDRGSIATVCLAGLAGGIFAYHSYASVREVVKLRAERPILLGWLERNGELYARR